MANTKKGLSLHVGVNILDPKHYDGWDGKLVACEADAEDMEKIAKKNGFEPKILRSSEATREAVIKEIKAAAKKLKSGDIFMLTYAGHGGQLPDQSGDEDDNRDETLCLFDGQMIDDELQVLWASFAEGVRILMISDSCHSGTVSREMRRRGAPEVELEQAKTRYRFMPSEKAFTTYRTNQVFYDEIARDLPDPFPPIKASVLQIGGCKDEQLAGDGAFNGVFTSHLKKVLGNKPFDGDYEKFFKELEASMAREKQDPNMITFGKTMNSFFEGKPFVV